MEFYKQLADSYDLMTRFEERFQSEHKILQKWRHKLNFKSALDVACGTGLHTILLAQMGIHTVGTDLSGEMLQKAQENAKHRNISVTWIQTSMQDLNQHVNQKFDAVFCLGNSIPHLLTSQDLNQALTNFYQVLNPNGHLVLQLLNYEKVLKLKERIVGIHRKGNKEFIRFYDFLENKIQFNILTIEEKEEKLIHSFQSTPLSPYKTKELENVLYEIGFSEIQFFGDMKFSKYHKNSSPNLLITSRKIHL